MGARVHGRAVPCLRFIRWRVKLMELAIAQCDFGAGIEHVMQVSYTT